MLIDGGDSGSGSGGSGGGGGSGEDVGKLTRKRLNRGLPGRKQGTVRIQVAEVSSLEFEETGSCWTLLQCIILRGQRARHLGGRLSEERAAGCRRCFCFGQPGSLLAGFPKSMRGGCSM